MSKFLKKRITKAGMPPGTLVHVGERMTENVKIKLFDYDEANIVEKEAKTIEECVPFREKPTVTWINVTGLHQIDLLEKLGKGFGLHPLIMEDILSTGQRPKIEDFGDHIFIVLTMFYANGHEEIMSEQISMVLGVNFVITFQERESKLFDSLHYRIRTGKGLMRKMGADYLAYRVLDTIIDNFFVVLEKYENKIEYLEEMVLRKDDPLILKKSQSIKRDLVYMRQAIWPLRDLINQLTRGESNLIRENTEIYLRDAYDHITQVIDTVETFRDILSGLFDVYLSTTSNKTNAVMKVLTIISTIFMPLNFLAGVYGMNFAYMPGLNNFWGFPLLIIAMFLISITMMVYFKKKSWV